MKAPLRNTLSFAAGEIASRVIGFFVTVYLARVLGPGLFGTISVGLAALGYLGQLSGPGIQLLEARNSAVQTGADPERVSAIVSLRLLLGAVLLLLTIVGSFLFVDAIETRDALWLHALMLIPLGIYLDWFFQGKEHFGALSVSKMVNSGVYALSAFLLIGGPGDFRLAPLSLFVGGMSASILLIVMFRHRYGKVRFEVRPILWIELLKRSLPVGLAMLAGQNAVNLGPIVVGALFTTVDVGMYSAGMKLIILLLLLDRTLNAVYLPVVSRVQATRPEDLSRTVSISLKVIIVLVVPLALCCFLAAGELVPLVFGSGYEAATTFFRVLLGYFVLTVPNSILVCTLIASGREARYTRILVGGSLLLGCCVIVSSLAIGPVGAAAGVVLGELSIFIMLLRETKRVVLLPFQRMMIRPSIAFLVMGGAALVFGHENIIATVLVCSTLFVCTLLIVGGLESQEMKFVKERLV